MRRVLLLVAFVYGADLYAAQRTLNLSQPAEGLAEVVVDVPVGDVTVTGCQCNQITAVVVISGKRWQLEEQDLVATVKGQSLQLSVKPQGREGKKLSADWSVKLPHHLAVVVTAGVSDVQLTGVLGRVQVTVGVGDVQVAGLGAPVKVTTGVGDVVIRGPWSQVGQLSLLTGVGSVTLHTPRGSLAGRGLVSETLAHQGPGAATVEASTGIGDVSAHFREH